MSYTSHTQNHCAGLQRNDALWRCLTAILALGTFTPLAAAKNNAPLLEWSNLPALPYAQGLAGHFSGVVDGDLVIAGGAFQAPEQANGAFDDRVWVLSSKGADSPTWRLEENLRLPDTSAYGVSITLDDGLLCVGGRNAERAHAEVVLIRRSSPGGALEVETWPALPQPLCYMSGVRVGDQIFIAGGQTSSEAAPATSTFLSLDLTQRGNPETFQWITRPTWPGPPRIHALAARQSDGLDDRFYLISGRNVTPGEEPLLLADTYSYLPRTGTWTRLADVALSGEAPRCVMGAPVAALGVNHIVVFGGASLEQPSQSDTQPTRSRDILAYHTVTDTWIHLGELSGPPAAATTAVTWNDAITIPGGETSSGNATAVVWQVRASDVHNFGVLNYAVLTVYLLALIAMGFYFSRRENSTEDFFKAGGRVPWWAAGVSIFGTQLSAITFLALPAKTFATDWLYFVNTFSIVLIAPVAIFLFLRFFRRLNVTTAYEYLERRFNVVTRLIGSGMFILLQFGRIGIVLLLPSIALSVVTGIDVTFCILLMGVLSVAYTVLGGIEAVIWTDVMQVGVLLGGALVCLGIVVFQVDGGLSEALRIANDSGKFHAIDLRFDLTEPVLIVVLIGTLGGNLISYGTDQTVIQRYLTTKDERSAARGIWVNAALAVPASLIFYTLGTFLYVFYKTYPERLIPAFDNQDAILPWFVVSELPAGLAGLLVAGVFAASMSSLDSSMNSVATAVTTDFFRRFRRNVSDHTCLRLARWVTAIVGFAGTVFALIMLRWDIKSLLDQLTIYIGLFTGGLGGIFLLGILTRRASGRGAIVGLAVSGVVQYLVKFQTDVSFFLYTFTGIVSCFVVGYAASLLLDDRKRDLSGLTVYTLPERNTPAKGVAG